MAAGVARDGHNWLKAVRSEVLAVLVVHPEGLVAQKIRELIPTLCVEAPSSSRSVVSQVLTYLGAKADIVRGGEPGNWRTPRTQWTITERWLGALRPGLRGGRWLSRVGSALVAALRPGHGRRYCLVARFHKDRRSYSSVETLRRRRFRWKAAAGGWLLPDDLDEPPTPESWVALLPLLDPTVMGWRDRDFYLEQHRDLLFDRQGNAGTTIWVDGRVVGHWFQNGQGAVELRFLERVSVQG